MRQELTRLCEQIKEASNAGGRLYITAGQTKDFYGEPRDPDHGAQPLDMAAYTGVISYEPSELVIKARAGTPLAEIESVLERHGQMLAFEPPRFGHTSTLGGCISSGLAGPRRMAVGGVHDFVLGARIIDTTGQVLSFGGEVMKNVAGYDVSRLVAGSLGSLGPAAELSVKVAPKPAAETTVCLSVTHEQALERCNQWRSQPLPITATAHVDQTMYVRLSGSQAAITSTINTIVADADHVTLEPDEAASFWDSMRDQTNAFFEQRPLWRIAVPPATPALDFGRTLTEWHGALRWVSTTLPAHEVREMVAAVGGHATLFRYDGTAGTPVFHPLSPVLETINRRMMAQFDPQGLFQPGRLLPQQQG